MKKHLPRLLMLFALMAPWTVYGAGTNVNGQPQEAAMTPTIGNGQRKQLTDLDWAALDDIGWDVQPDSPSS